MYHLQIQPLHNLQKHKINNNSKIPFSKALMYRLILLFKVRIRILLLKIILLFLQIKLVKKHLKIQIGHNNYNSNNSKYNQL